MARKPPTREAKATQVKQEEQAAVAAIGQWADQALADPPTKRMVHAVRACCPRCGSSDIARRQIIQQRAHHAQHGETVTTCRRWQRAACNHCRQWFTLIEDYN